MPQQKKKKKASPKKAARTAVRAEKSKVSLIVGVTKDLVSKVRAGELVNFVAQQVGGKGGGRPDMAQAGGSEPQNLDSAIASVQAWLEEKLQEVNKSIK